MSIVFLIAQIKKNNSIVDIFWGLGFILVALYSFFRSGLFLPRHILVTSLILLWAGRLSYHLFNRNWNGHEDVRYLRIIAPWKSWVLVRIFLVIFQTQAILISIISLPVIVINASVIDGLNLFDLCGVLIWVIGFMFEVVGDYQLRQFLQNPSNKGKIMRYGLWNYTRHPNYFGEAAMWWGIFVIALSVPFGILTIVSPITITYLLLFVSGVPLAEALFLDNQEYQVYKKSTSAFFPWWSLN